MTHALRTVLLAATAAAALAASACGSGSSPAQPGAGPATVTPTSTVAPNAPSQSPADATRDGVVAQLAALPFAVRGGIRQAISAPEGVWVISRPTAAAGRYADGCRLGPETGKYPTTTICTTDYGEVLLLDTQRTHILRAYPFAAVPPTFLRLTPDAVWCGRQGDTKLSEGMLPDAMVCRIDRRTLTERVRVFAPGQESEVRQPCYFPPASWTVQLARLQMTDLQVDAQGAWAQARNGTWTRLDPRTLAIVARGVSR